MFKKLTDSQKGWLIISTFIAEVVVIGGIVLYCNNSIKINDDEVKKLLEMDEFEQLIDMIKE